MIRLHQEFSFAPSISTPPAPSSIERRCRNRGAIPTPDSVGSEHRARHADLSPWNHATPHKPSDASGPKVADRQARSLRTSAPRIELNAWLAIVGVSHHRRQYRETTSPRARRAPRVLPGNAGKAARPFSGNTFAAFSALPTAPPFTYTFKPERAADGDVGKGHHSSTRAQELIGLKKSGKKKQSVVA